MCRNCLARSSGLRLDVYGVFAPGGANLVGVGRLKASLDSAVAGLGAVSSACVVTHLSAYRSGGQCNYSMGHHEITCNEKCTYFACSRSC